MTIAFKSPTTELERQQAALAAERRARLFGKPKVVNIIEQMRKTPEAFIPVIQPAPEASEGSTPLDYINVLCAHHGVSYELITCKGRMNQRTLDIRRQIVEKTMENFPKLTLMRIAALFKRNHSTILYIIGRYPAKKAMMKQIAERDRKAKALYMQGPRWNGLPKS